jgi:hypothetical protein
MIALPHLVEPEAKVLIVENSPQHVRWLEEVCQKVGFSTRNIRVVDSVANAEQKAREFGADVVILDLAVESPEDPKRGKDAIDNWCGNEALIVASRFAYKVIEHRRLYAVLSKPSYDSSDRIRYKEQLGFAIRSALVLRSLNGSRRKGLTRKWFGTLKPIQDTDVTVVITILPGITIKISRKNSFFTALSILLTALAVTVYFFLFRRG